MAAESRLQARGAPDTGRDHERGNQMPSLTALQWLCDMMPNFNTQWVVDQAAHSFSEDPQWIEVVKLLDSLP